MQNWNIPTDRAWRVGAKNRVIFLFIMFTRGVVVIKMSKMAYFLYFLLVAAKNQSQFGTNLTVVLTHFMSLVSFCTSSLKHRKTFCFLIFSRVIEKDQLHKMCWKIARLVAIQILRSHKIVLFWTHPPPHFTVSILNF